MEFMTDPADLAALKAELLTDQKGLGLTKLPADDEANANRLNNYPVTPRTTVQLRVPSLSTQDLYSACDHIELEALTDRQFRGIQTVAAMGQIFPDKMVNIVNAFEDAFSENSKSLPSVRALLYRDGSRAEQMYQDGLFTKPYQILTSDVATARQLP